MADPLKLKIKGTFNQISKLGIWNTEQLCEILGIDYYKLCMVDTDREVFTITQDDIQNVSPD